eukprot:4091730-Pyramimonas_sp.AAC.1
MTKLSERVRQCEERFGQVFEDVLHRAFLENLAPPGLADQVGIASIANAIQRGESLEQYAASK